MDTARYRAFLNAADTGSIKNAGEIMGYTSSGVSQLIRSLEEELNLTLLFRGKKGVSLTSAGEEMLPAIRRLVSQENTLFQLAADLNGTVAGTINIAAYRSLQGAWMPDIIASFQQEYPKVRINLYEGTQREIQERLISGKADMAFFNNSMMTGGYDWIPLMDDPMVAVLPENHPLAEAEVFKIESFEGERFIMPEHGFDYDVVELLGQHGVVPDVYLSTFDSTILLEMVGRGLGVSIINGSCMTGWDNKYGLKAIPLEPYESLHMGIAVLSLKESAPAVKKFAEYAEKHVIEQL
ncbi:MAG: LysR family transcriptional regulator [Clostridiales bacterium]|nr:LysR family transcriptional regulator [Candidatus Crickella merdequi]